MCKEGGARARRRRNGGDQWSGREPVRRGRNARRAGKSATPTVAASRPIACRSERGATHSKPRFKDIATLPSAESDELIESASRRRWPDDSLFAKRSDPARSTSVSVPRTVSGSSSIGAAAPAAPSLFDAAPGAAAALFPFTERTTTETRKIVCERDETAFIFVSCVARSENPVRRILITSASEETGRVTAPRAFTCPCWSSRSSRSCRSYPSAGAADGGGLPPAAAIEWRGPPRESMSFAPLRPSNQAEVEFAAPFAAFAAATDDGPAAPPPSAAAAARSRFALYAAPKSRSCPQYISRNWTEISLVTVARMSLSVRNRYSKLRGMIPRALDDVPFSPKPPASSVLLSPKIEYVLPEPVWPYAKQHELKPLSAWSTSGFPTTVNTSCWVASGRKT